MVRKGGALHPDRQFADPRPERRARTGIETGALAGGALGLVIGAVVAGAGTAGAVMAGIIGAAAGAALGRAVADRVSLDDLDRSPSERPYVGAHTPDED
jgi:hypothetical protein